jgi:hypothetical protein
MDIEAIQQGQFLRETMTRRIAVGVLTFSACFAAGCKRHPYDLAKVRQDGASIVTAMKAYEVDVSQKPRNLSLLHPTYLDTLPARGNDPGEWALGAGYMLKETSTIQLIFHLREDGGVYEYYLYDGNAGWSLRKDRKS